MIGALNSNDWSLTPKVEPKLGLLGDTATT